MELTLKPIAFIESCYRDRFAVPRQPLLVQDAWAFLRFVPSVQPELSLLGVEGHSHLWIIFGFHLNHESSRFHAKIHPPRLKGESIGLFATRTPHRPNPIGLSLVEVKSVNKNGVEVLGGDFADGTPVYDIKPYLPEVEAQPQALGGWSSKAEIPSLKVGFLNSELELKIIQWGNSIAVPNILRLIVQTLEQDPRPLVYRGVEKKYKEVHAFRLYNGDIHFQMMDGIITVIDFKLFEK